MRQEFARATDVVVDRENILRQRIAMQAKHDEVEQFPELVRQTPKHVMAQMKLSALEQSARWSDKN